MAVEVGVGGAIADIVIALYDRPINLEPLSVRDCVVLSALRHSGPVRIDTLEYNCGLKRGGLRTGHMERLCDLELAERMTGGRYTLSRAWNVEVELIAIEAKLSEYRSAIGQAARYRKYADTAYVMMPAGRAQLNRWTALFCEGQVGLLDVGPEGIRELIPPRKSVCHDWRREFALSRIFECNQESV